MIGEGCETFHFDSNLRHFTRQEKDVRHLLQAERKVGFLEPQAEKKREPHDARNFTMIGEGCETFYYESNVRHFTSQEKDVRHMPRDERKGEFFQPQEEQKKANPS